MSHRSLKSIVTMIVFSGPLLLACGLQTDAEKRKSTKTEREVTETEETKLSIEAGAAKGTEVIIPPGALAVGSSVSVEATDTPSEFSALEDVGEASAAIEVAAIDPDGNPVTELSTPMTIQIPYGGETSLLQVEESEDNLCALLKSDAGFFLWRRSSLTIDSASKKASFKSKNLGVFQLVYCGTEELEGFADAAASGVSSDKISLSLSFDSDKFGFGADQICLFIGRESTSSTSSTESETSDDHDGGPDIGVIIASGKFELSSGSQDLSLEYASEALAEDETAYVILLNQNSDQPCDFTVGESLDGEKESEEGDVQFNRALVFYTSGKSLAANELSGTMGDGFWKVKSVYVEVGVPSSSPVTTATAKDVDLCFESGSEQANAFSATSASITGSDEKINDNTSLEILYPAGAVDSSFGVRAFVGADCSTGGPNEDGSSNFEPYEVNWQSPNDGETLYLTPVKMKVPQGTGDLCLGLKDGEGNNNVATWRVTVGQEYQAFVPYNTTKTNSSGIPLYDAKLFYSDNCFSEATDSSSTTPPIDIVDQELDETFFY